GQLSCPIRHPCGLSTGTDVQAVSDINIRFERLVRLLRKIMFTKFISLAKLNAFVLLLVTLSSMVVAQSQATTGNIEGRVLDPKEAAVPGTTVTAINQHTGLETTATTNDEGGCSIILHPPETY